jgi:uncharacterized protein DUF6134
MPRYQSVLLILLCVVTLRSGAAPVVRQWRFDVTADGVPIGTHEYLLQEDGVTRTVQSDMRFRVRLLVVDAYRFDHRATETWQSDCLSRLDTRTEERGRTTTVSGHLESNHFEVDGATGRTDLPSCVMTFAYWNPRVLEQSHLINPQTGAWTPVKKEPLGTEAIDVRGQPRTAAHYLISTDKNKIELGYAVDIGEWLAMRTTTNDGHHLDYHLH